MKRRASRRMLVLALACAAAAACARDARPDLVLVTLDTTRADALGTMGAAESHTPHLDALAARGTLFRRAYASTPLTLPSHTSILTGLDPFEHGVLDNGQRVPDAVVPVTEPLAAAGYATAAFVAAFVLDSGFGLERGFARYDDEIDWEGRPLSGTVPQRDGAEVTARALGWLADAPRGPAFLWVHYYDVHEPRDPPAPFASAPDAYAAAVSYVDAQVGRLLEGVARRGRETLVVVVGDHGESLGEHDEATHGVVAYDSTLHVPLLVAGPGFATGVVSDAFVGARDVAPTLLHAAGLPDAARGEARALQPGAARDPSERLAVFGSFGPTRRFGWAAVGGVRDARFKYTAEPAPPELYDVTSDPGETQNLVDRQQQQQVVARLASAYALRRARAAPAAPAPAAPGFDARLAALGYVQAPQAFTPGAAPDPRRFVGALGWIEAARGLAAQGRVADSIRALEILAESPVVRVLALRSLGPVQLEAGRADEAATTYRQLLEQVEAGEFRIGLAAAELARGEPAAALAALEAGGLARDGREPRAMLLRARALLELERAPEALAAAEAVLAERPGDDAALALASLARAVEPAAVAAEIERLAAALAASAETPRASQRAALAELLYRAGRLPEAAEVLADASDEEPEALAQRAAIAEANGNPTLALALYDRALAARPSHTAWRRALAALVLEAREDVRAEQLYDELLAATPDDAGLRLARGVARFRRGQLGRAHEDFARAAEIEPGLAEAHFNLGLVALQAGRDELAEDRLRHALELEPGYAKAHFHLARLYRERGDARAAFHAEQAAGASHAEHRAAPPAVAAPPPAAVSTPPSPPETP